jgi:carbon catabolite-derepressing protein kinase
MIDNQFALINYIGKGGSSKVFLAKDLRGTKCVLKVIRKDKNYTSTMAESLLCREHEILQSLQEHPNIIKSHGVNVDGFAVMDDESENIMYSVLEYAAHGSISNFVRYTGGIEEGVSKFFMLQMCHAIEFMHSQGFAHLDIKLENILLDEYFNIKVADMGASV